MRSSVARPPRRLVRVIGPASALILAAVTTGNAQTGTTQRPASTPPATAPAPGGQPAANIVPVTDRQAPQPPPVVTFAPEGVSLEEALRLTLRNEPGIQLSDAEVDRLLGFAQEQSGVFDLTLTGGYEYSYRVQELTESRKEDERKKRRTVDDFLSTARPDLDRSRATVNLVQQILNLPAGSDAEQVRQLTALSPNLGSQVSVLNALIASQPSQAENLRRIRNDFLSSAFTNLNTSLQEQQRQVDNAARAREKLGEAPEDEVFQNTRGQAKFSKLFRNGIQIAPYFDFTSEFTNFKGKDQKEEFGGKGVNTLWTFHAGSDFLLPLMRGRGSDAVAAFERAARVEAQAGTLEAGHQRSTSVLQTAQAYWELRAAQEALGILERSAARQGDLLKQTQSLVNAGELARVELARSQAGEARARSRVLDARRRVYDARVELATALGIATSGADATLPTAARDPFPAAPDPAALQPWIGATAAQGARLDVEASARRGEAATILEHAAETDLRSRLDLTGSVFYTALGEVGDVVTGELENGDKTYSHDGFSSALDRWVGPSFTLTLQYEKPLGNNGAKGRLAQREAEAAQRQIEQGDIQRQVRLNVGRAATALVESIGRLKQTQEAAGYYDQTIQSEIARFRAGEATLINTITTEEQATETDLLRIQAQQDVANLIAQLRFETGTLVSNATTSAPTLLSAPNASGRGR
jgi:outer membrane protein TolC